MFSGLLSLDYCSFLFQSYNDDLGVYLNVFKKQEEHIKKSRKINERSIQSLELN